MAAKIKFKLDADQIKRFFVLHTEKLVLGVLSLLALFLLYKGVLRETYKRTPQELSSAAQNATAELGRSTFDPKAQGVTIIDYSAKAEEQVKPLEVAGFEWEPIRHPVWPRGSKRGVPLLLAVEDLQVHAGRGAFQIKQPDRAAAAAAPVAPAEPAAPARPRAGRRGEDADAPPPPAPAPVAPANVAGYRYAVIVGRVPFAKQIQAFLETYADAADRRPGDEAPDYRGAIVERAEVVTGAANEKLKWVPLSAAKRKAIQQTLGAAQRNEIARPSAVNPYLTEGIPTRQGEDFLPEEVAHPSMLAARAAIAPPAPAAAAEPAVPDEVVPDAPEEPAPDKPADPAAAPADAAAAAPAPADDALLFRYFDFTVEPGKRYRYRVKLWLVNPNYDVPVGQLEDEAKQQTPPGERFIKSPESAPTETVFIPFDGMIVAGEWSPAGPAKEPSVSVGVEQWKANDGARAQFVKVPVFRGQLVNFQVAGPSSGPGIQPPGAAVFEIGDELPRKNEALIPFRTEVAVLDMAPAPPEGGVAANSKSPPADILVLDASGRLRVCAAREMAEQFREINENFGQVNEKAKEREEGPGAGGADLLGKPARKPPGPR